MAKHKILYFFIKRSHVQTLTRFTLARCPASSFYMNINILFVYLMSLITIIRFRTDLQHTTIFNRLQVEQFRSRQLTCGAIYRGLVSGAAKKGILLMEEVNTELFPKRRVDTSQAARA